MLAAVCGEGKFIKNDSQSASFFARVLLQNGIR